MALLSYGGGEWGGRRELVYVREFRNSPGQNWFERTCRFHRKILRIEKGYVHGIGLYVYGTPIVLRYFKTRVHK